MNDMIFNEYSKTEQGLRDLLRVVRGYSDAYSLKLRDMEVAYLEANPRLYDNMEIEQLKYYREAFFYKLYLATMHLEQVWALSHLGKVNFSINQILENIFDLHQTAENDVLLFSFAFEGFIVQGNAFLDFYLLHICHIFKIKATSYMSSRKFLEALAEVKDEPFANRAKATKQYFGEKVFGNGNWGELLKKLRDSILHRDNLAPSFEKQTTLLQKVTGDWPNSLKAINCSRFCQDTDNEVASLITTIAPLLYEVEWKPGPYKSGL